jgi:hypothetical protein
MAGWQINDELERIWQKAILVKSTNLPGGAEEPKVKSQMG